MTTGNRPDDLDDVIEQPPEPVFAPVGAAAFAAARAAPEQARILAFVTEWDR